MRWRVTLLIEAEDAATKEEIEDFLEDLTWVGGCRDPENDPLFSSVEILEKKVTRGRKSK